MSNSDVIDYLRDYCDSKEPPQHGVLITGPWGCGKTHLVRKFFENRKETEKEIGSPKFLYVSLYGVRSYSQIEKNFFQQMHPILASKAVKLGAALAKGAIKTAFKVDLNNDGRSDETVSVELPSINLSKFLEGANDKVLIFDDLERCSIPVHEILGYINTFVEHHNCRTIIIANESEILRIQKSHKNKKRVLYTNVKEKLIGATLGVKADFDAAVSNFIREFDGEDINPNFASQKNELERLFLQSQTENLRILRQTMWSYQRFSKVFTKEHNKNGVATSLIRDQFFALSFEIKAGRLKESEITKFPSHYYRDLLQNNEREKSKLSKLKTRYPEIDFDNEFIEHKLWENILFRNEINISHIRKSIDSNRAFSPGQNEAAWLTIWHYQKRDKDQIDNALVQFKADVANRTYKGSGQILHMVGVQLFLSKIGAWKISRKKIVKNAKKYVRDAIAAGDLDPATLTHFDFPNERAWGNYVWMENETKEFKEILAYVDQRREKLLEDTMPTMATELLKEMCEDATLFFRRINISSSNEGKFLYRPILKYISAKLFVDSWLKQKRSSQSTISTALNERIKLRHSVPQLDEESEWFARVREILKGKTAKMPPLEKYFWENQIEFVFRD